MLLAPEGLLLHQRVRIKWHIWILQESIKNSAEVIQVSFDKALASWLAAGWGGCLLPIILHFPVGAAGSSGSQQASLAAGQVSIQESSWRGGKQRSLVASKSEKTLEGSHSHEKCQGSNFSSRSRMKYTRVCTCIYVQAKKGQIYICLCICTSILKCCFLGEMLSLFQLTIMNFCCFSAMNFLSRQLKAKTRQDNFREPS